MKQQELDRVWDKVGQAMRGGKRLFHRMRVYRINGHVRRIVGGKRDRRYSYWACVEDRWTKKLGIKDATE